MGLCLRLRALAAIIALAALAALSMALPPKAGRVADTAKVHGTALARGRWQCAKGVVPDTQAALCRQGAPREVLVDQVYVINLAKRADRWTSVVEEMKAKDVRAVRFDAIDGSKISDFEYAIFTEKNLRKLTKGLVGNQISHVRVWQDIADREHGRALILEDDAVFEPDFNMLDERIAELEAHDPNWHFVYTGRLSVGETRLLLKDEGVLGHFPARDDRRVSEHVVDPGASEGMWGYMVSAAGARAMIAAYTAAGMLFDVDLVIHMPIIRDKLRMYAFDPVLSSFNESDAYSDDSNSKTGLNLLKRANKMVAAQKYHEAIERYRQALALGLPPNEITWAHTNLGFLLDLTDGDRAQAHRHFELALQQTEIDAAQRSDTLGNFCYFLFRQGRLQEAKQRCSEGLALTPKHEKCTNNLQLVQQTIAEGKTAGNNLHHKHIDV